MNLGNGYLAINNINDNDRKYNDDTTRTSTLLKAANDANKQFRAKRSSDSIQIFRLENITLNNGLKSDSLKLAIISTAVKSMEEQRKVIEKDKENVFSHMQNEVEDNLQKILLYYKKERIKGFEDTTIFISIRLTNTYINYYAAISNSKYIIGNFMDASEDINAVNDYADNVFQSRPKSEAKKLNIRMFLKNVESVRKTYIQYIILYATLNHIKN